MYKGKKILALIPARGGSKGILRKNIRNLNGLPLIAHNIKAGMNSKYVSDIYVSTEDEEIAEISKKYGAKIIKRPQEFASDTASSESVLLHFADNVDFDILVFMQCTSPLTLSLDIDEALKLFFEKGYDSVLSVTNDHGGFLCGGFTWDEDGQSVNYDYKNRKRRQDEKLKYRENGAIYIMTKENLVKHKNRLHGNIGLYVMPYHRSYEIDEYEDLLFLNRIMPSISKFGMSSINEKKIKDIKCLLFDVDGIFTDGSVYLDKEGKEMLKFSRIDGKGIELAKKKNYITGIITSENSQIIKKRMEKLKIDEIHIGTGDKLKVYEKIKEKYNLADKQIAFCGDDIQDISVLKKAGLSICPKDAQSEVRKYCDVALNKKGGNRFVRAVVDFVVNYKKRSIY